MTIWWNRGSVFDMRSRCACYATRWLDVNLRVGGSGGSVESALETDIVVRQE